MFYVFEYLEKSPKFEFDNLIGNLLSLEIWGMVKLYSVSVE